MYIIKEANYQLDPKKIKNNPIPKDLKKKWMSHGGVDNPEYKEWILKHWLKEVEITKGEKGPVGSTVKAPGGEYIHQRKHDPDKYTDYRTIKKNGKLLRLGKTKDGKWEVQSVLTKE